MGAASTRWGGGVGTITDANLQSFRELLDGSVGQLNGTLGDWGYQSLTASATTVVKTGAGQLGTILVQTAAGNITVYDNTTATAPAILLVGALVVGPLVFNCQFATGLTIVLSGAAVATALFR